METEFKAVLRQRNMPGCLRNFSLGLVPKCLLLLSSFFVYLILFHFVFLFVLETKSQDAAQVVLNSP